jgi:hypothetical protein
LTVWLIVVLAVKVAFWNTMPCNQVHRHWHCAGTWSFHLHGEVFNPEDPGNIFLWNVGVDPWRWVIFVSSESVPLYVCALPDLSLAEVQVLYIFMRAIQKVRFPILFLLKGFLHQVGKHGFCKYIYSPPYGSSMKICCRWFPHQWLDEHKMTHLGWTLMFLQLYEEHGEAFLSRIFAEDDIWVLHSTSESKAQLMMWKHPCCPVKKMFKTVQSPGKMITALF